MKDKLALKQVLTGHRLEIERHAAASLPVPTKTCFSWSALESFARSPNSIDTAEHIANCRLCRPRLLALADLENTREQVEGAIFWWKRIVSNSANRLRELLTSPISVPRKADAAPNDGKIVLETQRMLGGIPALVFENGKPSDNYTQVKVFLAPEVSEGGLVIGVWVAPAPLGSVRGEEASQDKPKEAPTVELILVLPDGMPIGPAVTISQGKEETVQFPLTEKAREVLRGIQNVDLPALPFRFVVRYGSASGAVSAKESPA